ncbi:hypothetical protein L1049_005474 [Liquidambar formosana]|uniref:Heat shock factor-binding protein 1 n=1 Tax=Liquidambar formosana TaxID=63359 RepID=A0AAP0RR92_LIQFO
MSWVQGRTAPCAPTLPYAPIPAGCCHGHRTGENHPLGAIAIVGAFLFKEGTKGGVHVNHSRASNILFRTRTLREIKSPPTFYMRSSLYCHHSVPLLRLPKDSNIVGTVKERAKQRDCNTDQLPKKMDGHDSEDPKQSTADMTVFVQNLLQQMQSRFQTMSNSIVTKIDEMGGRINELEQSINELRAEMGVEGSPSPLAPSKTTLEEVKPEEGSA